MVLVLVSPVTNDAEHLFTAYLRFACLLWRNVYSDHLLSFYHVISLWSSRGVYILWVPAPDARVPRRADWRPLGDFAALVVFVFLAPTGCLHVHFKPGLNQSPLHSSFPATRTKPPGAGQNGAGVKREAKVSGGKLVRTDLCYALVSSQT